MNDDNPNQSKEKSSDIDPKTLFEHIQNNIKSHNMIHDTLHSMSNNINTAIKYNHIQMILHLILGIGLSFICGLIVIYSTFYDESFLQNASDLWKLIPRIIGVIFLQMLSFFFFRFYNQATENKHTLYNEMNNILSTRIAITMLNDPHYKYDNDTKELYRELSMKLFERNYNQKSDSPPRPSENEKAKITATERTKSLKLLSQTLETIMPKKSQ